MNADVLVLGSGIAGLMLALRVAEGADVLVLTKRRADDASTNWAQGGIAAVMDPSDRFVFHERDTLRCGAGLCDRAVVRDVIRQAPDRVRELEDLGVAFTRRGNRLALGREGGHNVRRIVHAGDFTGQEIEGALIRRALAHRRIQLVEDQLAVDLILESRLRKTGRRGARERCWGAYVMDRASRRIRPVTARVTVLATGGCGKVYLYTSNPDIATGDGLAMAYRAGAPVRNLEFVQFHPTCLFHPQAKSFLLSEALRGEGARLRTLDGARFMPRFHPAAELAPRDVVARAIDRELKRRGEPHVLLDITHRPAAFVKDRFPNIARALAHYGFDLTREPIPVVPAAHYMCGGVVAGIDGRTDLDGLLAIGEVACTGLHGANRLASNSLLEALVSAREAADRVAKMLEDAPRTPRAEPWRAQGTRPPQESVVFDHNWDAVRRTMWDLVGVVRSDQRLEAAARRLSLLGEEIEEDYDRLRLSPDLVELRNIALVGRLIVDSAWRRRESRGLHYNLNHPRRSQAFARPITLRLQAQGRSAMVGRDRRSQRLSHERNP